MLSIFLDSHTAEYDLEDKKQLIWDMAGAMNLELRQLAAAGAKVIQIEEPTIHFVARFYPDQTESWISWSTRSTTRWTVSTTSSCGSTPAGHPNMQKVYTGESYATVDRDLPRAPQGRRWTVEVTENDFAEIACSSRRPAGCRRRSPSAS